MSWAVDAPACARHTPRGGAVHAVPARGRAVRGPQRAWPAEALRLSAGVKPRSRPRAAVAACAAGPSGADDTTPGPAQGYGRPGSLDGLSEDDLPTQGRAVVNPQTTGTALAERDTGSDLAYLSELMAIQQQGPRDIGFFGTRNMGFLHQQLIEILSYAMILTENHIFTSGATGTNAAVIRGALRAERPDLLTVVLPQSLSRQPPESQELLSRVGNVVEMPQNDALALSEASRICNADILNRCQQVICFAFHDSRLLLDTCEEAKKMRKMVTLFYLD